MLALLEKVNGVLINRIAILCLHPCQKTEIRHNALRFAFPSRRVIAPPHAMIKLAGKKRLWTTLLPCCCVVVGRVSHAAAAARYRSDGYDDAKLRVEARAAGAAAYVIKEDLFALRRVLEANIT
jgi:hypothetical protein